MNAYVCRGFGLVVDARNAIRVLQNSGSRTRMESATPFVFIK